MKLTLSLQPGNKLQLPMEIDDDKAALMTVADFKGKIMEFNSSKPAEQLHVVYGSTILDDGCLLAKYGIKDGDTIKFLFAAVQSGSGKV